MEALENTSCPQVFRWFAELNQIPRCSGNEKAVSDWLAAFARERGLKVVQDEAYNIVIAKPGTAGYEQAPTVILQGHMDMVCEKEPDSPHDFTTDPIAFLIDGDFLHADRTTLGADNGVAVSFGLALLDADDVAHPPVEFLITTSEETGMDGASALDPGHLSGRRMINIDSEEEGKLLVSCAGGINVTLKLPIAWQDLPGDRRVLRLRVDGLQGGHSGLEIDKQRGSANKLLGRVLLDLDQALDLRLCSVNGGSKHNAIPREAQACLGVLPDEEKALRAKVDEWTAILKGELEGADPGVRVSLDAADDEPRRAFSSEAAANAVRILCLVPAGVLSMSTEIPGLVQTSNNLGVVVTTEDEVTFQSAIRSSVRTQKADVVAQLGLIAEVTGAAVVHSSDYPEWQYDPASELRGIFVDTYAEMTGEKPEISAIHAGLECGLFSEKFNGEIDLISFGPNVYDVHTPKEHISISSVERTYDYLIKVLAKLT